MWVSDNCELMQDDSSGVDVGGVWNILKRDFVSKNRANYVGGRDMK